MQNFVASVLSECEKKIWVVTSEAPLLHILEMKTYHHDEEKKVNTKVNYANEFESDCLDYLSGYLDFSI